MGGGGPGAGTRSAAPTLVRGHAGAGRRADAALRGGRRGPVHAPALPAGRCGGTRPPGKGGHSGDGRPARRAVASTDRMDVEVAIVGGGPVAATLAMLLARAGRSVIVLEKSALPRDKPCGEGLMPSGVKVLAQLGIDLVAEGFPVVHSVRYRLASGGSVRGDLATGHGCGVRRARLDPLLAARAAATPGVTFVAGCPALGVRVGARSAKVDTQRGELTARVLVGADGLRSAVAGWLGWSRPSRAPRRGPRHALVGHLAVDAGQTPDEILVTLLGDVEVYTAPSGPGEMLVAILGPRGTLRRPGSSVRESYRWAVERAHPLWAAAPFTGRVWGAGPFLTAPRTVAAGRAFLVGDAAGFLDPLTGDGIAAGLMQAEALARLLDDRVDISATPEVAAAGAAYRAWRARQWRRRRMVTHLALSVSGSAALARRALSGL